MAFNDVVKFSDVTSTMAYVASIIISAYEARDNNRFYLTMDRITWVE